MKKLFLLLFIGYSLFAKAEPIKLHPENPHYFMYKGKPLLIVTSAEHYGSILNLAFDYIKYLNTMQKDGMNYTRIFTGSMYWEIEGDFGITHNTLAPKAGTALAPWKRSSVSENTNGGNKFDMDQWDEAYFKRLKSFVEEAQKRDIIVEVTLFTSIYNDKTWGNCPVHPQNNINQIAITEYKKVHTLDNGNLLSYQEKFVQKMVEELNGFDNVIYEIQNEPWSDQAAARHKPNVWEKSALDNWSSRIELASDASLEWQAHMVDLIVKTEKSLKNKHLIAQNYCNILYSIPNVHPDVSILNFHYAWPEAITYNYGWNNVIGFDESGFAGSEDDTYRQQAWVFVIAGGGLFNNLDYSFAVGYEDGTLVQKAPGGGSPTLRKQLLILRKFFEQFDFIKFAPDHDLIVLAPDAYAYAISNKKTEFAIYMIGNANSLILKLPKGEYNAKWINPSDGSVISTQTIKAGKQFTPLNIPEFQTDIALSLVKR